MILENPMDRGAWQATVHGVAKSQIWLSDFTFTFAQTHLLSLLYEYSKTDKSTLLPIVCLLNKNLKSSIPHTLLV